MEKAPNLCREFIICLPMDYLVLSYLILSSHALSGLSFKNLIGRESFCYEITLWGYNPKYISEKHTAKGIMHYVWLIYFGMFSIFVVGLPINFSVAKCDGKKYDHTYSRSHWKPPKNIPGK